MALAAGAAFVPCGASAGGPDVVATALVAAPGATAGYCSTLNAFAYVDGLDGSIAPCALRPGAAIVDAVYLQNASRVGGTALAAYPLVRLRAGLALRLQFTFDAPAAIAQSRPGGGGSFPVTSPGFGLTYTLAESPRGATALSTNVFPPDGRFTPAHLQPRYALGLTNATALSEKWTVGGTASATSSQRTGSGMILPSLAASAAYAPNARTQFQAEIGTRIVTHRAVAQSFGDAAINQVLDKKLLFTVGVGTTFNAVNDAKPHYLASGFMYRP